MAEKHPDELELLSFVEEELDDDARHEVAEHLVACRSCTDQVRRLEAGREALRAAPAPRAPGRASRARSSPRSCRSAPTAGVGSGRRSASS